MKVQSVTGCNGVFRFVQLYIVLTSFAFISLGITMNIITVFINFSSWRWKQIQGKIEHKITRMINFP